MRHFCVPRHRHSRNYFNVDSPITALGVLNCLSTHLSCERFCSIITTCNRLLSNRIKLGPKMCGKMALHVCYKKRENILKRVPVRGYIAVIFDHNSSKINKIYRSTLVWFIQEVHDDSTMIWRSWLVKNENTFFSFVASLWRHALLKWIRLLYRDDYKSNS